MWEQETRRSALPAVRLRGFVGRMFDPNDPPQVAPRALADLDQASPEIARTFFNSLFGPGFADRQRRIEDHLRTLHCPLLYVHAKAPRTCSVCESHGRTRWSARLSARATT